MTNCTIPAWKATFERLPKQAQKTFLYSQKYVNSGASIILLWGITDGQCDCGKDDCGGAGKHPIAPLHPHGYLDATDHLDQIAAGLDQYPNANLGIALGSQYGFAEIEFDGPEGMKSYLKVKTQCTIKTITIKTGGDGKAWLFEHPHDLARNVKSKKYPGMEYRGKGIRTMPPSLHISGKRYTFVKGRGPKNASLSWLPDALWDEWQDEQYGRQRIGKVKKGGRNDFLFKEGCRLRNLGYELDEIFDRLSLLNLERCDPPMDAAEVQSTAISCARYDPGIVPVSEVLRRCGIGDLKQDSSMDSVEKALRLLADEASSSDPLRQNALRSAAVDELKTLKIGSPAKLVDAALAQVVEDASPASEQVTPWPHQVDGLILAGDIEHLLSRHLVLPEGGAVTETLWIMASWTFEQFFVFPYLTIPSAVKRSGKSLNLDIVQSVGRNARRADSITPSALFRMIERLRPTLLLDEIDTQDLFKNKTLRGILNAGHRRSGTVVRSIPRGDDWVDKEFHVYCPKALALIGVLPDTLVDRSIVIPMKRSKPDERREELDMEILEEEGGILQRKLARWALDNADRVKDAQPVIPEELHDRARDNWKPLLKVAEALVGSYPARARDAAIKLSSEQDEDDSIRIQLLTDIRIAFGTWKFLESQKLAEKLAEMPDRPWSDYRYGRKISTHMVAKLLKPFGIRPKAAWKKKSGKTARGYDRGAFEDAFERYLQPPKP